MKIKVQTQVASKMAVVVENFNENLFKHLKPPLICVDVLRFDGCKKGDEVHLSLKFLGMKNRWISQITASEKTPEHFTFIDEGVVVPWPLKSWHHTHRVIAQEEGVFIIDEISYKTPSRLLDIIFFPFFFGQFLLRKPQYKSFFKRMEK